MPGPLHGYRVVDLTSMISGPLATMILADQGADVIKVENPDGGDHTRAANNRRGGYFHPKFPPRRRRPDGPGRGGVAGGEA
jgi:crotonobetainyl-CoA:carnitine CoA-transferase CaiB-like acyl-CoA transferase